MTIDEDHDAVTAASLRAELERFAGDCWYDPRRRKIVYHTGELALGAYLVLQREQMEKHKWLESQKAARDLADGSLADWVNRFSTAFCKYWKHTHVFIPANSQAPAK